MSRAAAGGHRDTVQLLSEHGFDINETTKDSTPLLAACELKKWMAVADVNARNKDGKTAAVGKSTSGSS